MTELQAIRPPTLTVTLYGIAEASRICFLGGSIYQDLNILAFASTRSEQPNDHYPYRDDILTVVA